MMIVVFFLPRFISACILLRIFPTLVVSVHFHFLQLSFSPHIHISDVKICGQ